MIVAPLSGRVVASLRRFRRPESIGGTVVATPGWFRLALEETASVGIEETTSGGRMASWLVRRVRSGAPLASHPSSFVVRPTTSPATSLLALRTARQSLSLGAPRPLSSPPRGSWGLVVRPSTGRPELLEETVCGGMMAARLARQVQPPHFTSRLKASWCGPTTKPATSTPGPSGTGEPHAVVTGRPGGLGLQ